MASVSKGTICRMSSQSLLPRRKVLLRHQYQCKLPKEQRPHSQSAASCAPLLYPCTQQTVDAGNRASNYTGESLVIKSLAGQTEMVTQLYIFARILKCTLKGILFNPIILCLKIFLFFEGFIQCIFLLCCVVLFIFLRQGFSVELWLSWNRLCRPSWP